MKLNFVEKMHLFDRIKDRDIGKLIELSVRFKANKNYEKAKIVDVILRVKKQDIEDLKRIKSELELPDQLAEKKYVSSILDVMVEAELEQKRIIKQKKIEAKLEKKRRGKKKKEPSSESSFSLSEEICEAMAEKIIQDSKKHKQRL